MSLSQATASVNAAYTSNSIANTGGTVSESFADGTQVSMPTATKAWSYEADGGTHNANMGSSSSLTFTLSSLTGPLGTVAFANVLGFLFRNNSTTDSITLGGAAVHPWAPLATGIVIPPGGYYSFAAPATGWAVSSGSSDQLKIATGTVSAAVPFSLQLIGN